MHILQIIALQPHSVANDQHAEARKIFSLTTSRIFATLFHWSQWTGQQAASSNSLAQLVMECVTRANISNPVLFFTSFKTSFQTINIPANGFILCTSVFYTTFRKVSQFPIADSSCFHERSPITPFLFRARISALLRKNFPIQLFSLCFILYSFFTILFTISHFFLSPPRYHIHSTLPYTVEDFRDIVRLSYPIIMQNFVALRTCNTLI